MSVAKNYIYNVIYQIFIILVPLITVPYISRTLGSNGIGTYAYTNSVIQYFVLLGTIGVAIYGNRAIAYDRENKEDLSRTFWGIFLMKLITTLCSYGVFIIFLLMVSEYKTIFFLQSIYILSAALDISWLYMGLEDFKKTVVRNIIVKLIGVLSIFIFVKTGTDLWKYVLILGSSELFGQLTMWMYLPRTVNKIKLKWEDIKIHFLPSLSLFIPQIAIQIYLVLNKTMLGFLSNVNEVGYFDNADKIVKLVLAIVTSMGIVMLPRISSTFAKGEKNKVQQYIYKSFEFASYLSIPMMFGIAGIAHEFTPWFFGMEFEKTGTLIWIISPIIVFIAWSNVLGQQYLISVGRTTGYTISVISGALVNFILNLSLIGRFHSIGAAIATLVAEFIVTGVQLIYIHKNLEIRRLFCSTWKFLIAGFIMYGVTRTIGVQLGISAITTFIQIFSGMIVYIILLFGLKSEINKNIFIKARQIVLKIKQR
ncbi:flippase [Sporolactobacillus terrae]|uniref:Flippase n=1 Tax=Sporolactobacillus terrae TaxID=269673 RepID=A0ABX5Q4K1_9BACL|nr:flippase [Sporolactobacillus terrae]QAA21562.1 flippase [Sporolactobacillus terrae]QAA24534.1 flippase [Sporolactobacillus terrae]